MGGRSFHAFGGGTYSFSLTLLVKSSHLLNVIYYYCLCECKVLKMNQTAIRKITVCELFLFWIPVLVFGLLFVCVFYLRKNIEPPMNIEPSE